MSKRTKPVEITLCACATIEEAERIKSVLDRYKSLFVVTLSPQPGNVIVRIGATFRGATETKLKDELLELLACEVIGLANPRRQQ